MENFILECAACGCENIHHSKVEVFDRESEDSETGLHVTIDGDVKIDMSMEGNPSSRRDGVLIYLWCEQCNEKTVFSLSQHKGITYLDSKLATMRRRSIVVPDKNQETLEECIAGAIRAWENNVRKERG